MMQRPHQEQKFWPRVVLRKWLNISAKQSDYSADPEDDEDDDDDGSDCDSQNEELGGDPRLRNSGGYEAQLEPNGGLRHQRRRSETSRAQYINSKELKIFVGTWNVGGNFPPDDLDIDDWLGTNESADIYVLGLQEIVPLNAGNIFGAEDYRPAAKWENIIRQTLDRVRTKAAKVKSFSDPPSPSKFKPSEDIPCIEEEMLMESDSDIGEEIHPINEEINGSDESSDVLVKDKCIQTKPMVSDVVKLGTAVNGDIERQFSSPRRLNRLNCFREEDDAETGDTSAAQKIVKLNRLLSTSERIGLSWPEQPLHLLSEHVLDRPSSFKSVKSFKSFKESKSFSKYTSFKSTMNWEPPDISLLTEIDLDALMKRKRRSSFVRIVSKQMVGIFLTVWVRRSLRKHIQNLQVSTVGVGVMGYIGNKGSVSVSMSVYQTFFCFICTHLTAGEKDGDELKRNADVHEIHRRTQFRSLYDVGVPKSIYDHERIIWLGDLNYRINLSYEKTRELISRRAWTKLAESDQLMREFRKGRAFDGWSEGRLNFPPTYKYEVNSEKYYGEDPRAGRRTPAWCDRILSYGKGMKLIDYRRSELKFSDHRPVTATYIAEVEVFSPRKLQRALTLIDAEIGNEDVMTEIAFTFDGAT